ncbi:cytochrome p450 alkane hydroxylase [Stemphylium lycopersici]|uniref:Cytochrome p450 alkane hydroxylase n=1 Tax=Stemphylium lycopersici TaxID=183478 RepID=A0A364MRS7_STELY|nr:cytochrome p450 alkane hydroxylase [Stemphylium lycopersici]RAQ98622.1 cytochrome p450 alkane hydroxylase [Stemphylium lycopersici]RAR00941.1 cytochrome p450 alkane hydroxylase [Stemphylium lycopersici]
MGLNSLTFQAFAPQRRFWDGVANFYKTDRAISARHGCRAAPRLLNHRPFGLDRLEQIFRADSESRLMELFLFHFRQTGSTLEHKFVGTKAYGTIDSANVDVLLTHPEDFGIGLRREIALPMFGDGIFTQEGPDWKHSRDLLRPQLQHKHYANLEIFRVAVDDLVQLLATRSGTVDLQPLFSRLTLDTTTAFLFGESTRSLIDANGDEERVFAAAFDTAQQWVVKRLRLAALFWLVDGREFRWACREIHLFVDQLIDRNLSTKPEKHGFLHAAARTTSDRSALRAQMVSLLVAGRDTTASLLSWTIQHWVSQACTALRLYPPVPINTRTALKTTVLPTGGGPTGTDPVLIPKGSSVAFSLYAMHRRPDLFGMDAELFRPERWDLECSPGSPKSCYLPFSSGPRKCLGGESTHDFLQLCSSG